MEWVPPGGSDSGSSSIVLGEARMPVAVGKCMRDRRGVANAM